MKKLLLLLLLIPIKIDAKTIIVGDSLGDNNYFEQELESELGWDIENISISGEYLENFVNGPQYMLNANQYNPNRVIIFIGNNDVASGETYDNIKNDYWSLCHYYKWKGYEVWALTITPRNTDSETINGNRNMLNWYIKHDLNRADVVIDSWSIIRNPNNITQINPIYYDGSIVHFNESGYDAIINEMKKVQLNNYIIK